MSTSAYSMCSNVMILGPCAIDLAYYSLWNVQSDEYTLYGEITSGAKYEYVSIQPRIDYCLYTENGYMGGYFIIADYWGTNPYTDTNSVHLNYSTDIVRNQYLLTGTAWYEAHYYYPNSGVQTDDLPLRYWNFG